MNPGLPPEKKPESIVLWVRVLALACSLAAVAFSPWEHIQYNMWKDTLNHAGLAFAASRALAEGQIPLREVPNMIFKDAPVFQRYAIFQFYSQLPHTLSGLATLLGLAPYHSLLVWVFLFFYFGFMGAYWLARHLKLGQGGSLACAITFTLAPYHLVDWYIRGAYPELAAFSLIPWVLLACLKAARQPSPGNILLCALSWFLIILTHNIFHVWSLALFAAVLAQEKLANPKERFNLLAPGLAYALALAACAFFFAPVALLGRQFSNLEFSPMIFARYTSLAHMFSHPWIFGLLGIKNQSMDYFQVGWPILAGAVAWAWWGRARAWKTCGLAGLAACLLLSWSPVDFWPWVGPLKLIQFTFRILTYVVLFGSLVAGRAWDRWFDRQATLGLAGLALASLVLAWPYLGAREQWEYSPWQDANLQASYGTMMHQPYAYHIGEADLYRFAAWPDLASVADLAWPRQNYPGDVQVRAENGLPKTVEFKAGRWSRLDISGVAKDSLVLMPAPWYPDLYRVKVNGREVEYGRYLNRLAVKLEQAGDFHIEYCLGGLKWANGLSLLTLLGVAGYLVWAGVKKKPLSDLSMKG